MVALTRAILAVLFVCCATNVAHANAVVIQGICVATSDGTPTNSNQNVVTQVGGSVTVRNGTAVTIKITLKNPDGSTAATQDLAPGAALLLPHGLDEGKYTICGGETGQPLVKYGNLCVTDPNDASLAFSGESLDGVRMGMPVIDTPRLLTVQAA